MIDCFTDCYNVGQFYQGIKSVTDKNITCKQWKYSSYSKYKNTKSNICSTEKAKRPWCPDGNSYCYCDVPKCSDINSGKKLSTLN